MKRIFMILLCLLLVCSMAMPVFAAGSAKMSLSASAKTLYRGDSFTVTVKLTNDQVVGRGGIVLKYDSSVFEFVGGSCSVSGATLAEVSAGRNGGVFALAENRVVSGNIFTINMKVKSNAPFGTYSISGSASMDISCSVSGTSVTVACKHSYKTFTAVDGSSHNRLCSICQVEETVPHNWNAGTVKTEATCKETGLMTYTCTDCGRTKDEVIEKSSDHKYRNWTRVNEQKHHGTCEVCGREVTVDHNWTVETVHKEATCTETGSQDMKCKLCGEAKTEEIPVTAHNYTAFQKVDDQNHSHSCIGCGKEEVLAHQYSGQLGHNANEHYQACDDCGAAKEAEAHVPGDAATKTKPQVCTVCGRVLKPALNHVHNYAAELTSDKDGHWYACDGCDERSGLQVHAFENDCDTTCDTCGYVRIPPHDFSDILSADSSGHYYACKGCGEKKEFAPHSPGEAASIRAAQTCAVCDYEIAARVNHPHEFTADAAQHIHTCVCGETLPAADEDSCEICAADPMKQLEKFPWWIVCIAETVALIAMGVLLVMKKKK